MTEESIGQQLQKALRRLIVATLVLYFALISLFVVGWVLISNQADDLERVTISTNAALCTFRDDLVRRVEQSTEFLADNPNGFKGISPEIIRQSIENQQSTIDALGDLDCVRG